MHNAAFRTLGLDLVYVALRVAPGDLRRAIAGVRGLGFAGLNVTVPHKERIVALLDELSEGARKIGAVNTVVARGGRLVGDNTDAEGFRQALAAMKTSVRGKRVLILGAGGSARAVIWALARGGSRRIVVLNRTRARARALARFARELGVRETDSGRLASANDPALVRDVDLLVNCTSIGLDGKAMPSVALESLPDRAVVYDLVYGERPTPLVTAARRRGLHADDGRTMLLHQAASAFRLWTGRRAPLSAMAAALR